MNGEESYSVKIIVSEFLDNARVDRYHSENREL